MVSKSKELCTLKNWLLKENSKCVINEKIRVQDTDYGGHGIFAIDNIGAYQPIIKISSSYLLNFISIIRHLTVYNKQIVLPESFKHIQVKYEEDKEDFITAFYSCLTLQELLKLSSFQLISLYLVLEEKRGDKSWWKAFLDMLPTQSEFLKSPLIWLHDNDLEYFNKLPKSTQIHAKMMFHKFNNDYNIIQALLETHTSKIIVSKDEFLHAWMCVNSRCLYMDIPGGKGRDDNLTMVPFVDFINHSPFDQCTLKIDRSGFYVITGSSYVKGDELFLSYGPHSNEILLCEYGFTLPSNVWNDVDIADEVLKLLNDNQIEFLKEKDYYGQYTINMDSVSFRTEVALAVSQEDQELSGNRKLNAFLNGLSDGNFYKEKSNLILKVILKKLIKEYKEYLKLEFENDLKSKIIGRLYKEKLDIIEHSLEQLE